MAPPAAVAARAWAPVASSAPRSSGGGSSRRAPAGAATRPARLAAALRHPLPRAQAAMVDVAPPAAAAAPPQAEPLPELASLDGDYEEACSFADFANWLIPGRLLLGRYPFVEPSRCRSRDVGEAQLRRLLAAGVTAFVCLQAEIPEQAAMRIGGMDGFVPYRAAATLLATAMSPPPSLEEVAALRTPDLDRFLPPRRHPAAWASRQRIELAFSHCPIVDLGLPDEGQLRALLDELAARLADGQTVYVHCWGGRGRAGLVGACLLARLYGLGADEALERVQRSFDSRKDGGRRSPETDEQHAFVRAFITADAARP